ncbi:MAG: carbohydrate kinase [Rhodocyclaceae bacterium]|nr:carbohydrate kinase [Rhodocyclaceae bacterium]
MDSLQTAPSEATGHPVLLFGEYLADVFPGRRVPGGAPFNVACHLAAFGVRAMLVSRLGQDALGDELRSTLPHNGVDAHLLQVDSRHGSGQVDVVFTNNGHRFEIPPDQAFDHIDMLPLSRQLSDLPTPPELIYFGTLAQRNPVSRAALSSLLNNSGALRFVDLNLRPPWVDSAILQQSLAAADIVKLSEEELLITSSRLKLARTGDTPEALARRLQQQYNVRQLVVTCGAHGAWCIANQQILQVAPVTISGSAGDTVGAGDAFAAICILGHLLSWPLPQTLRRAATFAAAICSIPGAVPGQPGFHQQFQQEWLP